MDKIKNINLIIFDMDGLLFDTERISYKAMKKTMGEKGYEYNIDNYIDTMGTTEENAASIMKKRYGKNINQPSILKDYQSEFSKALKEEGLTIKPGARKLLRFLKDTKIQTCIASSSKRETIKDYLKIAGLEAFFDFYLGGDEIERGKPFPDIFLNACDYANTPIENTLVLEDSLNGLKAANRANIKCIIIPDLIEPNDEMIKNAFCIMKDLEQVINVIY